MVATELDQSGKYVGGGKPLHAGDQLVVMERLEFPGLFFFFHFKKSGLNNIKF